MKLDLIYMPVVVFALALITSIASRLIVNKEKVERCIEIIERWNEMREKAVRTKDRKLYRRVMKRKSMVDRAKSDLDMEKFKVYILNTFIFIVGMWLMSNTFSQESYILMPLLLLKLNLYWWYFINALWCFPLANRLIGSPIPPPKYMAKRGRI
ncbi:MAG: hypothetical protein DRJ49_00940 [Thermoprotei archaeon]|nr:MAG: hypothetical protein DRJ49_00940 [Thermoprotei archaeon]